MVSLSDDLADFPIEVRQKLFESHIKPFGANVHDRKVFGKKYETRYPDLPNPYKYEKDKAKDYLKPKAPKAIIKKPLKLYEKPKEERPEYYDGANTSTFDQSRGSKGLSWASPKPMVYVYPDGSATTKAPAHFKQADLQTRSQRFSAIKKLYEQKYK